MRYAISILILAVLLGSCVAGPSASKNESEIYGTWINTEYPGTWTGGWQKIVHNTDGTYKNYMNATDTQPAVDMNENVVEKWTDAEGNIWYKITWTFLSGEKYNELDRISNNGTVLEYVTAPARVGWPTEIRKDHHDWEYRIYYRQK